MDPDLNTLEPAVPLPRPRDFAWLLLAIGGGPPRERARAQQADLAGQELHRRILEQVAAFDPEPDALDMTLSQIIATLGRAHRPDSRRLPPGPSRMGRGSKLTGSLGLAGLRSARSRQRTTQTSEAS